jgi:hypothetical protein
MRPLFVAVFLLIFCSQSFRFYTTIELEHFLCYEDDQQHRSGVSHSHNHNHASPAEGSGNSDDGGFAIRHCKDTFGGIVMAPLQPLGETVEIAYSLPHFLPAYSTPSPLSAPLADPLPPFQPPRA